MCRLIAYIGSADAAISLNDLMVKPSHSILRQSYGSRERFGDGLSGLPAAINADGFGLGWYGPAADDQNNGNGSNAADETPGVLTSTAPAWSDQNLHRLSAKIKSRLIFGHIRAASLGSGISPANCHPFCCGRYLLQHNGHIGEFQTLKRDIFNSLSDAALACIKGTTDSEAFFAMFLTQVQEEERRITLKLKASASAAASTGGAAVAASSSLLSGDDSKQLACCGGIATDNCGLPSSSSSSTASASASTSTPGVALPDPFSLPLSPESMRDCTMRALQQLQALRRRRGVRANSLLNVCLTDGRTVIATRLVLGEGRPASLYYTAGDGWVPLDQPAAAAGKPPAAAQAPAPVAPPASLAPAETTTATIFRRPTQQISTAAVVGSDTATSGTGNSTSSSVSKPALVTCNNSIPPTGSNPISSRGVDYTMVSTEKRSRCVIIASERLTPRDEDWLPVPPDTLLLVHPSLLTVLRVPLGGGVLDLEPPALQTLLQPLQPQTSTVAPPAKPAVPLQLPSTATTAPAPARAPAPVAAEAALPAPALFLRKRPRPKPEGGNGSAVDNAGDADDDDDTAGGPTIVSPASGIKRRRLQMTCQGKDLPANTHTSGQHSLRNLNLSSTGHDNAHDNTTTTSDGRNGGNGVAPAAVWDDDADQAPTSAAPHPRLGYDSRAATVAAGSSGGAGFGADTPLSYVWRGADAAIFIRA